MDTQQKLKSGDATTAEVEEVKTSEVGQTGNGKEELLRKLGVDPGFGNVKVGEVQHGSIATFTLPSQVGIARARKDGLTLSGVVRVRRGRNPYRVEFEGTEWLVGPNVADYTDPINQMDFDRFTDSPELRATLYAALYQIVNGGSHRLALAMALPVEVVQDKTNAEQVEQGLKNWLLGRHVFSVNGVETVLDVVNVRCKIPQPVATWFEWGMDHSGQWAKGDEALRAPVVVIDQGFNTLDVLVVEKGKISDRYTRGRTLGMRRAAERLTGTLEKKYSVKVELYAANELVQNVVNSQAAYTYVQGQAIDVTAETRQALHSLETEVIDFVDKVMEAIGMSTRVLLTGGGALALAGRLTRKYPHTEVMYEPVLTNARGLAKMAQRKGFLEG